MVIKRLCGICQGGCQVNITLENQKIIKVEPDNSSPQGNICIRGNLAPEILYHADRLTHPLIRNGKRGDGIFRRSTWNEALEYAANLIRKSMEKYGSQSVSSYLGRGVLGTPVARVLNGAPGSAGFVERLGSPNNFDAGSLCNISSSMAVPITTIGITSYTMTQDVTNSDYIFIWGKNPTTDNGPQTMLKSIKSAKQRGAKLIVIDPRKTGIGELADFWIPVIPGSDGALALAMLKIIIESKRYDENFVMNYTYGFDEFKEYLNTLALNQLSEYCGIPLNLIHELTDIFCSTNRISLVSYTGLEYQLSGVQNGRAVFTLWAITGKLDVEGSIYFNCKKVPDFVPFELPNENKPLGIDAFPMFYKFTGEGQFCRFPDAVLNDNPYPVRTLVLVGGSPLLTYPDSEKWHKAYEQLDCLIVSDRYLTEDARYADVVFPACTLFETYIPVTESDGTVTLIPPVIEPVGECKDDALIIAGLAKHLGIGDDFPETDEEFKEWICRIFSAYNTTFTSGEYTTACEYKKYENGSLRADGQPGFPTPSGKFEICSTLLKENGFTPYPEYNDIRSITKLNCSEFPFTLTTGARSRHRMGVFGVNIPSIAKIEPYPYVDIHPTDAKEFGITDGDWTKVTTPFGSAIFKAKLCDITRHCIHIPHGGGSRYMPEAWQIGNINTLTSLEYFDPITGFATIKSLPCSIEKTSFKE